MVDQEPTPEPLFAIWHDSLLWLNQSNDPSIPPDGLELYPGVPAPVTAEQAAYLETLNVTVKGQ